MFPLVIGLGIVLAVVALTSSSQAQGQPPPSPPIPPHPGLPPTTVPGGIIVPHPGGGAVIQPSSVPSNVPTTTDPASLLAGLGAAVLNAPSTTAVPAGAPAVPVGAPLTPVQQAASLMNAALTARGYKICDQAIYQAFQRAAGLTADGFPGTHTMTALGTVLIGIGQGLPAGLPIFPWSSHCAAGTGDACYDGSNAPTLDDWQNC